MNDTLASFARVVVMVIVVGFAVAVFYRLLTGRVGTRGLLSADDETPSPNSVQLLLMTIIGALWYIARAVDAGKLPDIPTELLVIVGASNVTFVGTNAYQWFLEKRTRALLRSGKKES